MEPKAYKIISKNYGEGIGDMKTESDWLCSESLMGREITCDFIIAEKDIDSFAQYSGDFSPIHISNEVAREKGFPSRVAHGVLQASFISAVVGMEFPGEKGILQQIDLKYRKPCFSGDTLSINLKVVEVHTSVNSIVNKIRIKNDYGLTVK